jgi:ATP-binding cassette ChvD family protein
VGSLAGVASDVIYTMHRVDKFYGPDRQVLGNISLSFLHGAKIGVLGPNGAGKSTLLRIMAGREEPSSGTAELHPSATVGLLEQEPQLDPAKDVRGNVEDGVRPLRDLLDRFGSISAAFAEPDADFEALLAEQTTVQEQIDRHDAWGLDQALDRAMDALRLPDGDRDVSTLSGGERRRVALCRLLLSSPDLLLLDEPTNHLDAESVAWLERFLESYAGTVIAVTHDRYFLDNVAGWILELDRGRGIPFRGNYSSWLEQKEARLAQEEKSSAARRRTLQRELEWVRMTPRARHDKSKARLAAYEKLLAEEQSVRLDTVEIHIPAGPRLGDVVVEAAGLRKGYGDRLLFEDLGFSLPPGGIVGVVGPNGAGKTTLFRLIAGEEQPDDGELTVGDTVQLAYVDQARADLVPTSTVWQEISGKQDTILLGTREVNSRQYVSWFNFRGGDQQKPVKDLSGGERNRVHLAKLLRSGGNLLLLDEPTNDLDVDTLRALEEALLDFAGCAVVISHDRWFLDRVATHILAFEGDSQVTWFEGSWAEYAQWVRETRGPEALEPHRIRYKPLVRPG